MKNSKTSDEDEIVTGRVRLAAFDNSWFDPGSRWLRVIWYVVQVLTIQTSLPLGPVGISILRAFGAKIGTGVVLKPRVRIKYPWNLNIGNDVWIGEDVWIDNLASVSIGSDVCISQGAYLFCGNHDYSSRGFDLMVGPIVLEDGAWVGARGVVCPAVTCATHSVLAAGSVATKNLDAYSIYQGNPAMKIRARNVMK
jgi:putative colanic acid biosynthesis acetyltransferase WcaF